MKTRFSTLVLLLGTLAAACAGCDVNIDPPDGGGSGGNDTDGEDESSGGKSVLSAGSSDGSGGSGDGGESDGSETSAGSGLTTAGPDDGGSTGADPDGPGDPDGGDTGLQPGDACASYCQNELTCDDYYASAEECMTECGGMRADAAACAPALDELNACLGSLSCDEFFQYWAAIDAITNDQDPGDFPCLPELAGFANCLDGATPPGGA